MTHARTTLVNVLLTGLLAAGLFAGCGNPPAPAKGDAAQASDNAGSVAATPGAKSDEPAQPKADEKTCFNCQGEGMVKCDAPGCQNGRVLCPGGCLQLDRGVWVHLAGQPATELWQKIYYNGRYMGAYSEHHVGDVIAVQNGQLVDTGVCPICGGTGKVNCTVCNGTGHVVCPICQGQKYIPASWTPFDNPWVDKQSDAIRLSDGRIVFGKVSDTTDTGLLIKTREGKWLRITDATVVTKPSSTYTNRVAQVADAAR
jgi:hypothetical protein